MVMGIRKAVVRVRRFMPFHQATKSPRKVVNCEIETCLVPAHLATTNNAL